MTKRPAYQEAGRFSTLACRPASLSKVGSVAPHRTWRGEQRPRRQLPVELLRFGSRRVSQYFEDNWLSQVRVWIQNVGRNELFQKGRGM